jgi:hypothetical protein
MTAYRAIVLFTTGAMLVLHVLEWKIGFAAASGIGDWAQKLRLSIRLEALYYLLVLPLLLLAPNTLVSPTDAGLSHSSLGWTRSG